MDKGHFINFHGSEESIKRQLGTLVKGVGSVEDIGFVYRILEEFKKRNGYDIQYLKDKLDKKLNLINKFEYN